jgi:FKBP-type peptidyl-prolyl cis-trans isomerase FkpA
MLKKTTRFAAYILMAIVVFSCGGKTLETKSGMAYKLVREGKGGTMKLEDFGSMTMFISDKNDSLLYEFNEENGPFLVRFDSSWFERGQFFELLQLMKKGDSITFEINADEFFGKGFGAMAPPHITFNDKIKIALSLDEIMNEDEFKVYSDAMTEKAMAAQERRAAEIAVVEQEILQEYFADNNIQAQKTASGLWYVIHTEGKGKSAGAQKTVKVHYAGSLLDGPLFDTSMKSVAEANGMLNPARDYAPFEFTLGVGMVIRGWDEGIALLKEGTKATLYIPSTLGYGEMGAQGVIPPNAILKFDVELVEVVN